MSRAAVLAALALLGGCAAMSSDGGAPPDGLRPRASALAADPTGDQEAELEPAAGASRAEPPVERRARPVVTCPAPLPIYEEGRVVGRVCEEVAAEEGLTVVDLSDSWTPVIFTEDRTLGEAGRQPYRSTYLELADEAGADEGEGRSRYLELYGIFPTFRVLAGRLGDEARHRCHDRVDDSGLEALDHPISSRGREARERQRKVRQARHLRVTLERAARRLDLESIDGLEEHETHGPTLERYRRVAPELTAIEAVQAHLRCDGLLGGRVSEGAFDWGTAAGLRSWQARHMIISPWTLDDWSRRLMAEDSREWELRAVLRALRERVADATGILEDGSASHSWGTVLGRHLDGDAFRAEAGQPPAPGGAADLVSPATEAAARALGWTSPEAVLAFLRALGPGGSRALKVALRLPEPPSYQSDHMDLRAEIDRGDVNYDYGGRGRRAVRRPVLTLYARDGEREVALVRWPTTIGGWQPENHPEGGVGQRYKDSPAGPRIWRDLVASPTWLPPESTPDDELVQQVRGVWQPKRGIFGPGYMSAYGLVMMMHHKVLSGPGEGGRPRLRDEGIRSHGSVSYASILTGHSHGCHRLHNHLAVRIADYLIRHRRHVRRGSIAVDYARAIRWSGEDLELRITTRGYLYELTPPVAIDVLEGNIVSRRTTPPVGFRDVRRDEDPVLGEDDTEAASSPTPPPG